MITNIIRFSVYNRFTVLALTGFLALVGWYSFQRLPIDAIPDITNVQVQINTVAPGLAPEEIERNITFPLESSVNGIPGVTQVRSITRFGLSVITVAFEDSTDIYRARQQVSERLQGVADELPEKVVPKLGPVTTGLGEVFHYAVESEKIATDKDARIRQLMELRALQDWFVKPRLLTVKGVSEVNTIGGHEKQFHIQPDPKKLSAYGIHFRDISDAIEATNRNVGGGYIQQTGEQFIVQGVGLLKNIEDIRNVPVRTLESFRTLKIGDIAKVGLATELRTGAALVDGEEAVLGTVLMLTGENSRTVSDRVAERLEEIRATLPAGYKIETLYDRSTLVNATLGTVEHNLLTGAGLVVVILLLLVGNIRAALITAVMIPLSLLITFIFMRIFGISGNLMSLGALDFGIIVDGAVIVLDNCVRVVHNRTKSIGRSLTRAEVQQAVFDAAVEIRSAAGFGELIIIVVFLPIFALQGIEGKTFIPMAATFSVAVVSALMLSFTLAPALAGLFLKGDSEDKEPWLMRKLEHHYAPILQWSLKRSRRTILISVGSVLAGVILFSRLGGEFLPQLDEGSIAIQFARPVNISLDQSVALQEKSESMMREYPEITKVFSRIGTSEIATDPMGVNFADTYVMLKPYKEWPKRENGRFSKLELEQDLIRRFNEEIPGQKPILSQPIQMRFNELLEGTRAAVSVKVFGEDMDKLVEVTKEVAAVIQEVPGAGDVEVELRGTSPMLKIEPRQDVLLRMGVSTGEVLETVETAIGGKEVGHLFDGVRRFPIFIRLDEELRSDLDAVYELPVGVQASSMAPLSEMAKIHFSEGYSAINREESKRRSAVLVNPRGRDTESFVLEAQKLVSEKLKIPPGYYLQWGGNFKNLQESRSRLLVLAPVALLLVLLMIYAAFKNIAQTFLVFSCIPLALVGGVMGLIVFGLPFSISAGVGFIALSGIAVLNGVVLLGYFNSLQQEGLSGDELVTKGSRLRLRPVLMTALVDIFGFLPMVFSSGVGAEVQKPLASVVIGGIISSTLLTLIVLPTLYRNFEKHMKVKNPGGIHHA
jgi:heavy metal efflux system protein